MPEEKTQEENLNERLKDLEGRLKKAEEKAEKYLNQLKYAKADLENLQKQTQRRIDDIVKRANGRLIAELLPIIDELGLAVSTAKETKSDVLNGLEMVKSKLERILENEGLKTIDAEGEPFDPYYHEALAEVETGDYPDGFVVEEIRKGYTYQGRVLRASIVKVAREHEGEKDE